MSQDGILYAFMYNSILLFLQTQSFRASGLLYNTVSMYNMSAPSETPEERIIEKELSEEKL
jgi:hypothetical protein